MVNLSQKEKEFLEEYMLAIISDPNDEDSKIASKIYSKLTFQENGKT